MCILTSSGGLFVHKEILEILEMYRPIWALDHALGLMRWDLETYMPRDGAFERGVAISEISLLMQKLIADEKLIKAVEKAEAVEGLNDYERGLVRVLKRAVKFYTRVPPRVIGELSKVTSEASVVWREAKAESDFLKFRPYLEKIVDLEVEVANHLGYDEHPYDALLDIYEEGLRTKEFQAVMDALIPSLKKTLDRILAEGYYSRPHPLENEPYDVDAMRRVNYKVLSLIGFDERRLRLDTSAHPFTLSAGVRDARITVRYEGVDFKRALYSLIHEYGHALYALQVDERFATTPLARDASLGISESQSRFWENVIGRSRSFVEAIYDVVAEELGLKGKYDVEELYRYFNIVKPSFIRVDADEVTYNFHIALRFELEKMMISKEVRVEELPELWNEYMDRYLGVRPKRDSEGVLQDIHWSIGSIGYFPTYTIGTLLSVQIKRRIEEEIDLDEAIRKLNFEPVKKWLRGRIHIYGSVYPPKDLARKAVGEYVNPSAFLDYIDKKYRV